MVTKLGPLRKVKLLKNDGDKVVLKRLASAVNSVPGHHISKVLAESRLPLPVRSQSAISRRDPIRFPTTVITKDLNLNCLSHSPLSVRFCLRHG
jgi:hypothetical protein